MKIHANPKKQGDEIYVKKKGSIIVLRGGGTLFLGWSVYAFLRPLTQVPYTYLFPKHLVHNVPFLENIPSFIHALSFSLILSPFLNTKKQAFIVISLWGLIALSLEIIQHKKICLYLSEIKNVYRYDFLEKIYWYSKTGIFDNYDRKC